MVWNGSPVTGGCHGQITYYGAAPVGSISCTYSAPTRGSNSFNCNGRVAWLQWKEDANDIFVMVHVYEKGPAAPAQGSFIYEQGPPLMPAKPAPPKPQVDWDALAALEEGLGEPVLRGPLEQGRGRRAWYRRVPVRTGRRQAIGVLNRRAVSNRLGSGQDLRRVSHPAQRQLSRAAPEREPGRPAHDRHRDPPHLHGRGRPQ